MLRPSSGSGLHCGRVAVPSLEFAVDVGASHGGQDRGVCWEALRDGWSLFLWVLSYLNVMMDLL